MLLEHFLRLRRTLMGGIPIAVVRCCSSIFGDSTANVSRFLLNLVPFASTHLFISSLITYSVLATVRRQTVWWVVFNSAAYIFSDLVGLWSWTSSMCALPSRLVNGQVKRWQWTHSRLLSAAPVEHEQYIGHNSYFCLPEEIKQHELWISAMKE